MAVAPTLMEGLSGGVPALAQTGAITEVEKTRALAETLGAIEVAKRFPRDEKAAFERIMMAFTRPTLAATALYEYARGGESISGLSIRAAEVMAQQWGNIQFGVFELEQRIAESTVESFAWDLQTNSRTRRLFQVPHIRHTRKGQKKLEDPRDIYELIANVGARRMRACILQLIPGDIQEAIIAQILQTQKDSIGEITDDVLKKLLDGFVEVGVTKAMIEKRIQRSIEAITPALLAKLRRIYVAMKDGVGEAVDYFELDEEQATEAATRTEALREKLRAKREGNGTNGAGKADAPADSHAADAANKPAPVDTQNPAADATETDDKQKARDLRGAIGKVWSALTAPSRTNLLTRLYGAKSLTDLNVVQLEELLADLPEHIGGGE